MPHTLLATTRNPVATIALLLLSTTPAAAFWVQQGCEAVPVDKCGVDWSDSCLVCGTDSAYDCEKCCPGCTSVTKGTYKFCECKGPKPGPSPSPPVPGTWDQYQVAGMQVLSVTTSPTYEKVVVMLHGGGETGSSWRYNYQMGWFGNTTGLKYVFPTSAIPSHVWFNTYKNGCGLDSDCAYDIPSIQEAATRVSSLIDHEKALVGGDASKVYLAGFSEGAQLTGYIQLAKLDYALGGVIVMDGFPLPPLFDMPGHDPASAKANSTYYGQDMRWMIWHGSADPIFPEPLTMSTWDGIFDVLGIQTTLKVRHVEPGMTHTLIKSEFDQMVSFINAN